jgi:hypothetical protein
MKSADLARGAQIAAAALTGLAALAAAGCGGSDGGKDVVVTENPLVCVGGNSCQGMSECAGGPGGSECAGMNECAGMGWSYTDSEEECEAAGGHIDDES